MKNKKQLEKKVEDDASETIGVDGLAAASLTSLSGFGERAASPQSDRCGLYSSSSRMLDDLKLLCTTGGTHTSCRYLENQIRCCMSDQSNMGF